MWIINVYKAFIYDLTQVYEAYIFNKGKNNGRIVYKCCRGGLDFLPKRRKTWTPNYLCVGEKVSYFVLIQIYEAHKL